LQDNGTQSPKNKPMQPKEIHNLLSLCTSDSELLSIAELSLSGGRISTEQASYLYQHASLNFAGSIANYIREKLHGDKTYFNKNIHIEPTNICVYSCKFCSYSRKEGQEGSWEMESSQILSKIGGYPKGSITEVHIVGGVHPDKDVHYFAGILRSIKQQFPWLHIKAFTAVELEYMIKKAGMGISQGLIYLKEAGLDSIPGGGAEIFDTEIRRQICGEKSRAGTWLRIHRQAHLAGIPSNATMLYGHIENYGHRAEHMEKLRQLQDETGMFNAFIPLKFKSANNELSYIKETSHIDDLKNYAIARIFMDNIPHIKAYWPMIGKDSAQMSLAYGVDDIDGTIDDTTKIYSMAGSAEAKPMMNTEQMAGLIRQVKRLPVERDSVYNIVREY
jgi:aminodeoxyfutalosine synthase